MPYYLTMENYKKVTIIVVDIWSVVLSCRNGQSELKMFLVRIKEHLSDALDDVGKVYTVFR